MTLKEAAEILGTSPDNLRGAIQRGSLKAKKLGRDWIVTPTEVERYRRENRRASLTVDGVTLRTGDRVLFHGRAITLGSVD